MKHKKKYDDVLANRILLDTNELQSLCGCGRATAVKIGMEAEAKVTINSRVLWNRKKVEEFIDKASN